MVTLGWWPLDLELLCEFLFNAKIIIYTHNYVVLLLAFAHTQKQSYESFKLRTFQHYGHAVTFLNLARIYIYNYKDIYLEPQSHASWYISIII